MPAVPPAYVVARRHPAGRSEALTNISRTDHGLANGASELRIEFRVVEEQLQPESPPRQSCTMITQTASSRRDGSRVPPLLVGHITESGTTRSEKLNGINDVGQDQYDT
jgi:hypothetical protein